MCKDITTEFGCSHEVTKRYGCPGTWDGTLTSLYNCPKFEVDYPMEIGPCNDCRAVSGLPLITEKLTAECADGTVCDEIDEEASDSDVQDDEEELADGEKTAANDEDEDNGEGKGQESGEDSIQEEGGDQSANPNVIT